MIPTNELSSVEFAVVYVKNKKSGGEQMRFFPRCCDCRKILLDISEANLAAVDCEKFKLKRIATHGDLEIYQQSGRALVFCWECDRKKNRVPWQAAIGTFRGLDESQRFPEPNLQREETVMTAVVSEKKGTTTWMSTPSPPLVRFFAGRSQSFVEFGGSWRRMTPEDEARSHTGYHRETLEPNIGIYATRRPNSLLRIGFDL
jgi:hypothetical protein